MKKILVCLLLCLCACATLALVGCGSDSDGDASSIVNAARNTVTLSFWIVTEDETTKEAMQAVEEEFNSVTETQYTTRVEFVFCTADEYKSALDAKFAHIAEKPKGYLANNKNLGTYVDENGMTRPLFPEVDQYQMDILLITDKAMLTEYSKAGKLTVLNDSINNTYKNITKYIYNDILDNSKIDGNWYGVPNNSMIGDYTFMLVNKEMADKYYYLPEQFTSFGVNTPAAELIDLIAKNEDTSVISPMLSMADYPLVKYWTKGNDKTILTTMYPTTGTAIGAGVSTVNLFADANYRAFMTEMFICKENGYFLTNQEKFGVGVITGDYSVYAEYGDEYYISVLDYPRLEEEDVFSSMLAVSTATANLGRSMEIIQALTCSSELRNILQYGVEGVHYELEDNGVVDRLNNDYMMNLNYTGNVMMAYPEEGMDPDVWENAILQNQQSMLSIVYGTAGYLTQVDAKSWTTMCEVSNAYFDRLYRCETVSEFNSYVETASSEIAASDYYAALMGVFDENGEYLMSSINGAIQKWWVDVYGALT